MQDWWTPETAAYIGAYGVAIGGTLYGVVGGGIGGVLAARGMGRSFVLGVHVAALAFGVVMALSAVVALVAGQPYHVWYPLALPGFLFTVLPICLIPVIRSRYASAEQQRLEGQLTR